MTDGGKLRKPSVQPRKVAGTIIDTPNNNIRNSVLADELLTINGHLVKGNSSRYQTSSRGRGTDRRPGVTEAAARSSGIGVGSSRLSGTRQLSGNVKSLQKSSRWHSVAANALKLESSRERDARSPISPILGTSKRQRLEAMDSGDSSAKTQPQSLFAATATEAGLRASQMLQDISKDAAADDDDQVLELVSGNTSDNDVAGGEREALSKQRRAISPESVQPHDCRDEGVKDSSSGDEPKSAALQGSSSTRVCQAPALGDSEEVVSSGRVQRSLAGFSSKPVVISSPKPQDFFSLPSFARNSNQRAGQPAEKLVNQLRPKTHHATDDDDKEGQSNSVGRIGTSDLGSSAKPPTPNAGWKIPVGRSRDPLASIYQDSGSTSGSPMAHRRRTIASGLIDLRSPSPPPRPAISPPLKPQGRRLSKSSPQKQPQQRLANVPTKSFLLRGVRIGNHVQIADTHAANPTKDPAKHLKLTIRYVQRTMEISGLRESNELMKISVADISALEYNEQRNLAVMCMIPNDTMESLFEEDVFDPSCDDKSRCLIYLCWDIQAKGDKTAFTRLQESFGKDIAFATMDASVFQKYASELTKPTSIDLISSDDDSCVDKSANGTANSSMPLQSTGRSILSSIGANRGPSVTKSPYWSSVNSVSTTYASSIGERTRGRSKITDDALWDEPSMSSKRTLSSQAARRTSSPSFFSTVCSSYDLRKPNLGSMAEPSSSLEEDCNSRSDDDDFVVQHQKVGVDISSLKFEYPPEGAKPIHVGGSDIYRLRSGEFLNDTIIEFYMRYIGENLRTTDPKLYERCFFFNTFFFKKLSQRSRAIACDGDEDPMGVVYSQLKKWTASVDLFGKDYIFVPINENIHWYLAIIANPRAMLPAKLEAPDSDSSRSDPSRSDIGAASLEEPAGKRATPLTVDLPPPSSPFTSLLSSEPSPAKEEDLFPPLPEDGNSDVGIEMDESPAKEDMVNAGAVLSQAKSSSPRSALTPSTSELEADLKLDLNLGKSDNTSLVSDRPPPPPHVIDLSCEAMPLSETAATDVLKAKSKYVDPETTPSIIILDSLGNRHQPTFGLLRGYMQAEANYKHHPADVAEAMVGKYAKVPLQTNLCDCGVFLLQYIENFLKDPTMFMSHALNGADMRAWFNTGLMREKRNSMMRLAIRLASEYEQLQNNKADAKDSAKSEAQQAVKDTSEGSDRPSDPSPAPSVAMDSESGGKEPRPADDAE